jgi:hypothetical protein
MARRFVVLVACVPALALAGCGSGSSSAGTLTKAQYDAKLNRMCFLAADKVRELHMDNSLGDWKAFGPELAAIDHHFANRLHPEEAPAAIASAAQAFARAQEKVVRSDEAAITAANAGDRAKLRLAIARVTEADRATSQPAQQVGATDCYFGSG